MPSFTTKTATYAQYLVKRKQTPVQGLLTFQAGNWYMMLSRCNEDVAENILFLHKDPNSLTKLFYLSKIHFRKTKLKAMTIGSKNQNIGRDVRSIYFKCLKYFSVY